MALGEVMNLRAGKIVLRKIRRKAVGILAGLVVLNGMALPAVAGDKASVTLQCSTTKVVLTCTKFDGGHCVESSLVFYTGTATHVVLPAQKIPQNFIVPTIADDVACWTGNKKFAVFVTYTPGCSFDECEVLRVYDLNGTSILTNEDSNIQEYFGNETMDPEVVSSVSLRGGQ